MSGRVTEQVWRKGWRQKAAATQAASAELAALFDWLDQDGYRDITTVIRNIAMQHGVRNAVAAFRSALHTISGKRA